MCGFNSSYRDLRNHANSKALSNLSLIDLANAIYKALLEPLEDYWLANPLAPLPLGDDSPEFLEVTEHRVYKVLGKLNPAKACGPDAISDWLLKENAELPAHPITIILDSFKELLPSVWKFADVTPVPKKKPIKDLTDLLDMLYF